MASFESGSDITYRDANGNIQSVNLDDLGPYPLWSACSFSTTFSGDINVFKYSRGDNVQGTSTASTKFDTNMLNTSGQLLDVEKMVVYAIRIILPADIPLADIKDMLNKLSYAHYVGGEKPLAEGPVAIFPAGCGISGFTTQNAAETWVNGHPSQAAVRSFADPFVIVGGVNFFGQFNAGAALSLAAARKVLVVMDGMRSRYVQ